MDVAHIPRSFWHAVSFCMVIATLGLLYIAYKSSTISIEISNAKIEISSAISQVKEIKSELERENIRLLAANDELKEKSKILEDKIVKGSTGISLDDIKKNGIFGGKNSGFRKPFDSLNENRLKELEKNILSVEESIRK